MKLIKLWTPEIFMECYCDARNKPMRCEITKPQTASVISLWFWGLLAYPELYCDWPEHNQHSRKFSGVHGFLQPAKTSVSPRSSSLGAFREEERLRLSGKNSILMTQINVYIINSVVMGIQIQICTVLRVFWSILVNFCVHLPTSSSRTQILLLEKSIFNKYWLFC